jgi:hypothetical protein
VAWQRAFVLMSCLAVAAAAGCRPQLAPDPDAVLYYFRDARVQGEVKRVWPEGQTYVDNVLSADAKLQAALKPLLVWQTPESLWPREDPRWQDPNEVKDQIDALTKLVKDVAKEREKARADLQAAIVTNDAEKVANAIDELIKRVVEDAVNKATKVAKTGVQERTAALDDLQAAVAAVPASLKLAPADASAFVDKVWQALALDGQGVGLDVREAPAKFTEFAQTHLNLFQALQAAAGDLDPQTAGMHFKDAARQQQIEQSYADLAKRLQQQRDAFLQYAERELLASRPGSAKGPQERYLGFRRAYVRKQLEALPKAVAGVEERTQIEIERAERGKIKASPAQIAFWKQRVKTLAGEREELKSRVEAILKKAQAST